VVRFRKMVELDAFNSNQLLKENLNFREVRSLHACLVSF